MKKAGRIASTLLVALVAAFAASLLVFKLLGGGAYAVLSSSMEPTYPTGSLLYVLPTDCSTLEEGDIITYSVAPSTTVTHRIANISAGDQPGELLFTTKGDANDTVDATETSSVNVVGVPVACIPLLGYFITYVQQPPWLFVALVIVALLLAMGLAPAFRQKNKADALTNRAKRGPAGIKLQEAQPSAETKHTGEARP